MCLIAFDWQPDNDRPLVLAANRDEFHARPTQAMRWWPQPNGLLGGRDAQAGGTWMAVRRDGRFAALTNVRDPKADAGDRSRGELPIEVLVSEAPIEVLMAGIHTRRSDYGPFNLIAGDVAGRTPTLWQVGTHIDPVEVSAGLHALSNHALDTPWPKSIRAVRRLERALHDSETTMDTLLGLLDDREPAVDDELPDTGVGPELERMLSAPFIVDARYGTRSSSALVLRRDRRPGVRVAERSFDVDGKRIGERSFSWSPQ